MDDGYTPSTGVMLNSYVYANRNAVNYRTDAELEAEFYRWLEQEHQKWWAEGFKDARRGTKMTEDKTNFPEVTRIEVIDNYGRAFVRYYDYRGVTVVLQDDKRTMKIFANEPRITPPGPKFPDVPELPDWPESVEATPDPNEPNTLELIEELQKNVIMLSGWMRKMQDDLYKLKPRDGGQFR